jgi:DNA-binding NtrC family response regulator
VSGDERSTGIIGDSSAIRAVRALVERVAPLRMPVLIQGPTGSGKELVARALHTLSGRRGRFVAVNVCAIADAMFEATLFGHVRGAFTGAVGDAAGYLAEADGGTLFLDEIGGLSPAMQAKLLRALETHEFRPVGGRRDQRSEFRVVAATNEAMHVLVATGRFRADLAHRLDVVCIDVPPLAERPEDVPPLARHFAALASSSAVLLAPDALEWLRGHDWPGNVRELKNLMERALALAPAGSLHARDLEAHLRRPRVLASPADAGDGERGKLLALLARCEWDTAEAARRLGLHRATVYRRMDRLGIVRPRGEEGAETKVRPPPPPRRTRPSWQWLLKAGDNG